MRLDEQYERTEQNNYTRERTNRAIVLQVASADFRRVAKEERERLNTNSPCGGGQLGSDVITGSEQTGHNNSECGQNE